MKLDDWKAGKLSSDDPWVQEALKRGLVRKKAWGMAPKSEETPNPVEISQEGPKAVE